MRRTAALAVLAAACAPGLRAQDLDAELAEALRVNVGAVTRDPARAAFTTVRIAAHDDPPPREEGAADTRPAVRLGAAEPSRAAARPRATTDLGDLVVGERLAVVPLPAGDPASAGPGTPGALAPRAVTPAETTVPVASTGRLDLAAAGAYDDALSLVRADRCHDALEAFASFLTRWPDHPHADNAMYWRGECYLRIGETRRGLEELAGLVARYPTGNKAPDALLKLRMTWRRLGDDTRADEAERRLLVDFPGSDAARRVRAERQMR